MAKSLLLVDDSVAIREVVALTFENTDLTVRAAADLEKAWEALQDEPADIVIADGEKSQIGGWKLCRRLKEDPVFRSIPIILLFGEDDEGLRPLDITPDALLSKPFTSDDLAKTVAALIGLDLRPEEPDGAAAKGEWIEAPPSTRPAGEEKPPVPPGSGHKPDAEPATPRAEESPRPHGRAQALPEADQSVEDIRPAIESAALQSITELLKSLNEDELRRLLVSVLRETLTDLAPQITALIERVAREVVPGVAEVWIEREIERLKGED
ncbi:MAG: response regulator [Nitrospinota bacterium]